MEAEKIVELVRVLRTNDLWPEVTISGKKVDANRAAADCIEKLQTELEASKRMEMAATAILNSIEWVGSGAKGRIEDAINVLRGQEQEGE